MHTQEPCVRYALAIKKIQREAGSFLMIGLFCMVFLDRYGPDSGKADGLARY